MRIHFKNKYLLPMLCGLFISQSIIYFRGCVWISEWKVKRPCRWFMQGILRDGNWVDRWWGRWRVGVVVRLFGMNGFIDSRITLRHELEAFTTRMIIKLRDALWIFLKRENDDQTKMHYLGSVWQLHQKQLKRLHDPQRHAAGHKMLHH